MRISDWSSDVCSSDLAAGHVGGEQAADGALGDADRVLAHRRPHVGGDAAEARRVVARQAEIAGPGVLDSHLGQNGKAPVEQAHNGRATRREKVGKDGMVTVGAVASKKKKKYTQ